MSSPSQLYLFENEWHSEFALKKEAANPPPIATPAAGVTNMSDPSMGNAPAAPVQTPTRRKKPPVNLASGTVPAGPGTPAAQAPPNAGPLSKNITNVRGPKAPKVVKNPAALANATAVPGTPASPAVTNDTKKVKPPPAVANMLKGVKMPTGGSNTAGAKMLQSFAQGGGKVSPADARNAAMQGIQSGMLRVVAADPNARRSGPAGMTPPAAGLGKTGAARKAKNGTTLDQATKDQLAKALKAAARLGAKTINAKEKKASTLIEKAIVGGLGLTAAGVGIHAATKGRREGLKKYYSEVAEGKHDAAIKTKAKDGLKAHGDREWLLTSEESARLGKKTASVRWSSKFGHAPLIDWAQDHFEKQSNTSAWAAPAPQAPPPPVEQPAQVANVATTGSAQSGGGGGNRATPRVQKNPARIARSSTGTSKKNPGTTSGNQGNTLLQRPSALLGRA